MEINNDTFLPILDSKSIESNTIHFCKNNEPIIIIKPNGDFYYKGELVKGAVEVYEKLAEFVGCGRIKEE